MRYHIEVSHGTTNRLRDVTLVMGVCADKIVKFSARSDPRFRAVLRGAASGQSRVFTKGEGAARVDRR